MQFRHKEQSLVSFSIGWQPEPLDRFLIFAIDIEKLQKKELEPPYKPDINDDLKYFDSKLTAREDFAESIIEESHLRLIQQN